MSKAEAIVEMGLETVSSADLRPGDVFSPLDAPEDVVDAGDVFWKHPTQHRVRRVFEFEEVKDDDEATITGFRFLDPNDLATQIYLDGAFKKATVIRITNFKRNGNGQECLVLPWRQ